MRIVRVAVPIWKPPRPSPPSNRRIRIPLIADIHFDHRLAIAAARHGADGLRINPGNIGGRNKSRPWWIAPGIWGCPSASASTAAPWKRTCSKPMAAPRPCHGGKRPAPRGAAGSGRVRPDQDFDQGVGCATHGGSLPPAGAARTDYPLHVGITEAGSLYAGVVKSALGIGMLLAEGIGDTLRVSLTRDCGGRGAGRLRNPKALDIRHRGPEIISCPTCGRCGIDLMGVVEQVENALLTRSVPVKLAIMGCVVNGPGEAREADIGVAGGEGQASFSRKERWSKKFPRTNWWRCCWRKWIEWEQEKIEPWTRRHGKMKGTGVKPWLQR
jgi:(E)-4-hydroxy-3-methylbut-2-enyl-diphosphate synthase